MTNADETAFWAWGARKSGEIPLPDYPESLLRLLNALPLLHTSGFVMQREDTGGHILGTANTRVLQKAAKGTCWRSLALKCLIEKEPSDKRYAELIPNTAKVEL